MFKNAYEAPPPPKKINLFDSLSLVNIAIETHKLSLFRLKAKSISIVNLTLGGILEDV